RPPRMRPWRTRRGGATTTSRSTWPSARSAAHWRWLRKRAEETAMTTMIGQPINRVDGPLKVTGQATYAYEHWDVGQPLYGFIVGATIGKGRITRIDTTRAERSPGVCMVMTHQNAPAQGTPDLSLWSYARARPALS